MAAKTRPQAMLAGVRGRSYDARRFKTPSAHRSFGCATRHPSAAMLFDSVRTALKESIFTKILLTLLTLSFGIWGVGDFIGAGGLDPGIAVKIGKTEVHA